MLAEQNNAVHEAAVTMRELTADDKVRLQCEARERYERDRISLLGQGLREGIEQGKNEQKAIDDAIIAEKDAEIAALRTQLNQK